MSKFKVGDKVKIIECLSESVRVRYINKIATITKTTENNEYEIDLDNGKYFWYPFEFELYEKHTIHNLINDFDEGTEFESDNIKYKIYKGNLFWNPSGAWLGVGVSLSLKQILEMKFIKVEEPKLKPMTFEEAVHTLKKVKYEFFNDKQDKFYPLNVTIQSIGESYDSEAITNIILNGTWFAEGVYE